jgi:endonuclease-3
LHFLCNVAENRGFRQNHQFFFMTRKERFDSVLTILREMHPEAETELHYRNPYELLVAVVLSAQCTDKRVNQVTPALFDAFPDAESLSRADADTIFPLIRSVSYPNNKARHLAGLGRMLCEKFGGEVPADRAELEQLPGVGRKTANVIASVIFHQPAMAVDTHVYRVSGRLGLTRNSRNPLQAEKQLMKYIPEEEVRHVHHRLILHGRYTCTARNPACGNCPFTALCLHYLKQSRAK